MDYSTAEQPGVLEAAMELVVYLRKHCAWDRKQTRQTLIKHLIEESHEVASAIMTGDDDELMGELGDLLLNLAFQVVIAEEEGTFDRNRVWEGLEDKMKRRHPHLFGLGDEASWEQVKAREDGKVASALDGVPNALPPLAAAYLIQRRASGVGFDWGDPMGGLDKIREETLEVAALLGQAPSPGQSASGDAGGDKSALEEELGDLIFSAVNLARLAGVDPSVALGRANLKFGRRFRAVENKARSKGFALPGTPLEDLDRLWNEVKAEESSH